MNTVDKINPGSSFCTQCLTESERGVLRSSPLAAASVLKSDPQAEHLMKMAVGLPGYPILEATTMVSLANIWHKLDFKQDGHLCREDFESALGTDVLWLDLLILCNFNDAGFISSTEFIEGFVLHALNTPFRVELSGVTSAMNMLKEVQRHANELVKLNISDLHTYMKGRGVAGW